MTGRMRFAVLILCLLYMAGCSPTAMVKPLEKGRWAASGSFGGPLIGFGDLTIPVPFTAVGAAYGIDSNATVTARIYPTAGLFGVAQADAGVIYRWRSASRFIPGISTLPHATFMIDRWQGKAVLYPGVDVNAWWDVNKRGDFLYTGMSNWFELQQRGAAGRRQEQHWIPAAHIGFTLVREKWNTAFELKYLAPGSSNEKLVVDYRIPAQRGAAAIFVSFTRKF